MVFGGHWGHPRARWARQAAVALCLSEALKGRLWWNPEPELLFANVVRNRSINGGGGTGEDGCSSGGSHSRTLTSSPSSPCISCSWEHHYPHPHLKGHRMGDIPPVASSQNKQYCKGNPVAGVIGTHHGDPESMEVVYRAGWDNFRVEPHQLYGQKEPPPFPSPHLLLTSCPRCQTAS